MSTESSGSRPQRSDSVEVSTAENQGAEKKRPYDERVAERAAECVKEFEQKYPHRANLPLTRTHGESLNQKVVEEEYIEEYVESESDIGQGHTVQRLDRAEPLTWADALLQFLIVRQPYDDGLCGKFRDLEEDETFTVPFRDCWTSEYGDEQSAINSGAERQLMGGTYPDKDESIRAGSQETDYEWSDTTAAIVLTRTGSSIPDGERLPVVDFAREVETWTSDGSNSVYQTVRNICEYHLDLEPDEWGFIRGDDPHGISSEDSHSDEIQYSINAGYPHHHDVVYLDLEASNLPDIGPSYCEETAEEDLENQFYSAIEKHLELCDIADPEAHTKEKAVEARIDLNKPAGYATSYLRLDDEEPMMEQPVEMQAFAAAEWAMSRQRIGRSDIINSAAKADFCKQSPDCVHGGRVRRDRGRGQSDIVCAECGSGVGIEAETLTEARTSDGRHAAVATDGGATPEAAESGQETVQVGARIGESTSRAAARETARQHSEMIPSRGATPAVLGELGINPDHADVVEEVIAGESPKAEPVMGEPRLSEPAQYRLEAVIQPDGTEEPAAPGGGGSQTTDVVWPEQRLLDETRLQYVGESCHPTIIVDTGDREIKTQNPETAASLLVSHGYRSPWHAELALDFTRHGDGLPTVYREPESVPPGERG